MKNLLCFSVLCICFTAFTLSLNAQAYDPPIRPESVSVMRAAPTGVDLVFLVDAEDVEIELVDSLSGVAVYESSADVQSNQQVAISSRKLYYGSYIVRVRIGGRTVEEIPLLIE